ncbi:MAG: hypothetical protein DRP35_07775 [Candidatus Zixiibacteriota bacterium]|nr:MAG: hypothetical protein DRP35_07775 [candidate division Zixibacteria bacterium]
MLNNRYPTACGGRNVIPSDTVIPAKAGIQSSCQKKTPPQAVGYPVKELLNNRYPTACGGRNIIPSDTVIPAKAGIHSFCKKNIPLQAVGYRIDNFTHKSGYLNILKRSIYIPISRLCKKMRFCISMSWIDNVFFLPIEKLFFKKIEVCTLES